MKYLGIIMLLCVLVFAGTGESLAKKKDKAPKKKNEASKNHKVTICHKGKNTITVAESALKAHLNHGDTRGECPPPPQTHEETVEERAGYVYRYYSRAGVYYDVTRKLYFFLLRGQWQQSGTLPASIILDAEENAVDLEFDSETPYLYHEEVLEQYPQEQEEDARPTYRYLYLYYPGTGVYYDIQRDMYFYQAEDGEWKIGDEAPDSTAIQDIDGVELTLDSNTPYEHHEEIATQYPAAVEEYQYLYYPDVQVYFDENRGLYFYLSEKKTWQSSSSPPESLFMSQQEREKSVELTFESEIPYIYHEEVVEAYPKKIAICHKDRKTLWLPESAIIAHLRHGDTLGECESAGQNIGKKN